MSRNNVSASHETFENVLSNPIERSKKVEEYIEQSVLPKRYGISKSTLSYRISKLGIKTFKRGRACYLNLEQLELLDKLDKFCQSNDGARIEKFLDSLEPLEDLYKVCNPYGEETENVIERSNERDATVLKGLIEECLSLLNQSLSQNQAIDSERQLWINHAVNSDKTINELKQKITQLETSNSNLHSYALMQVDDKKRMQVEIDQLRNALALLNRNSQGENVVNFVSRQHQQKIPLYNPKTMNHSS
jgi:DNA-binding Lrp family transcriptional regulator